MAISGHTVQGQLDAFLDELSRREDQVADEAAGELIARIPAYADAGEELLGTVRETVRRTFATLIMLWREERPITPTELEPLIRMGIPPMGHGITLEEVLHAYRLAAKVIHSHVEQVGPTYELEPSFLIASSQLMWEYLNDLSTGLTDRWRQLERERLRWREDLEQVLVHAVLLDPTDLDQAIRVTRTLGLTSAAAQWRVVVAEPVGEGHDDVDALLKTARGALRHAGHRPLVGTIEGCCVVLARDDEVACVVEGLRSLATVGVSRAAPPALDLHQSFVETRTVVDIAHRRGTDVLWFDDAWVDRFLLGLVAPEEFADVMLAPVRGATQAAQESMMETLDAFVRNQGRVTEMARVLHLHPQSVRYRLKKLREVFGDRLDDPDGRLGLHIALEQVRLMATEAPGGAPVGT